MSNLQNYLARLESVALDCDQLEKMGKLVYFDGKQPRIKCVLYENIPHTNIDKYMANLDSLIILYQIKNESGLTSNVGHFICIVKRSIGKYSHFDSYGINIAEEMSITHENPNIIRELLGNAEYDTNSKKIQQYKGDVNTCGLHCLMRSLFFNMNNSQYIHYISSMAKKINADQLVTLIFRFLLK
jgi:hypothetical protein